MSEPADNQAVQVREEAYASSREFQGKVIALMLRDPLFLRDCSEAVRPEYFDKDPLMDFARLILKYNDDHRVPPTRQALEEEIRLLVERLKVPDAQRDVLHQWINFFYGVDLSDADYVRSRVTSFAKAQAFRRTIAEVIPDIKRLQGSSAQQTAVSAEILDKFKRALQVGDAQGAQGVSFDEVKMKMHELLGQDSSYSLASKVLTPFPTLNQMTNGGFSRGELVVVMARMGVGKTQFCVNLAMQCIHLGYTVVHYAVGDMQEIDLLARYTQRAYMVTLDDIRTKSPKYMQRMATSRVKGHLVVKYFPPGLTTVHQVVNHFEALVPQLNSRPTLVIVDYPDQLKGGTADNMYAAVGEIYDHLAALASRHNVVLVAPSQVHRTWDGKVITLRDISNSDLKGAKCDIALSLNQDVEEKEKNTMRIWVDKNRRGESGRIIETSLNFSCSAMWELSKTPAGVTTQGSPNHQAVGGTANA